MSEPFFSSRSDRAQFGDPRSERRTDERFTCFARAIGRCVAGPDSDFEAEVIDLCAHGVGLRVSRTLEPGGTVLLILRHNTGIVEAERLARVAHARPDGDGWIVGCEFTVPLTPTEVRCFQVQDFTGT